MALKINRLPPKWRHNKMHSGPSILNTTFSQALLLCPNSEVDRVSIIPFYRGQASLSIINSQNLPKLMSIESVRPSNHLILCYPLLFLPSIFPSIRVFSNELFAWGGQRIGVSASTSVPPMNTQDWSPLGWIGWISLQSKGLSSVFSNSTVQKHQFFGTQLSL